MTRENLLIGIIGVLLGFIIGFMFASNLSQRQPVATASQNLPANHPQVQSGSTPDPQKVFADVQADIKLARSEPNNFDAQMKAAERFYQIQRYDQAIEFLLKANQLKPDSYEAVVALGQVNIDAQHWDQAEKWLKAALLKKPEDVGVLQSLTFALLEKGDKAAAERAIATLEKVDPKNQNLAEFRDKLSKLKS
ncbi:MAG TPA: tetratricopeptide repeat protein [Pyrinomonadaceae bacterium]|nr:tetratricopeptide repeat protein [Pyrinomonadaceae bacterium]